MNDSADKLATPPPASGAKQRPGYAARVRDADIPLLKSEVIVGRSASADIVIDSALVSRRHAMFVMLDDGGIGVQDLESRNGTFVNGVVAQGRVTLRLGDRVLVGDHEIAIVEDVTSPRSHRVTATAARTQQFRAVSSIPGTHVAPEERTRHSSAFNLLGGLVDKAISMGHGAEAERLLASHLAQLLTEAQRGKMPKPDTAATAAGYALKLAAALSRPGWVDYAIKLYAAIGTPLPMPLVDELFSLLRRIRGIDLPTLRTYIHALRKAKLSPSDRFALQRLEGLLKIAL